MKIDDLDRALLDNIQSGFPLDTRPFARLAELLGSSENDVLERLRRLQASGIVRRIGPVFDPSRVGFISTLCAASVENSAVDQVACFINRFDEVTHNYLRDHEFNIWFTIVADSDERIEEILSSIRAQEGVMRAHSLPSEKTFKIKVQFNPRGDVHGTL